ncbi:arginine-glutamic acid dipeptide repeats protein-like isoform X2 [Zophobas morio]|uniref:arginine-glutamic acid dipeptide repeats protein-like isoform X2 n=1 Tax=Zophobas morio TaxID=2755281 RepID=UPI003082EEF8
MSLGLSQLMLQEIIFWTDEDIFKFESGMKYFYKDFIAIHNTQLSHRKLGEIVAYYYMWKKTKRRDILLSFLGKETSKHVMSNEKRVCEPGNLWYRSNVKKYFGDHNHDGICLICLSTQTKSSLWYYPNSSSLAKVSPNYRGAVVCEKCSQFFRAQNRYEHTKSAFLPPLKPLKDYEPNFASIRDEDNSKVVLYKKDSDSSSSPVERLDDRRLSSSGMPYSAPKTRYSLRGDLSKL